MTCRGQSGRRLRISVPAALFPDQPWAYPFLRISAISGVQWTRSYLRRPVGFLSLRMRFNTSVRVRLGTAFNTLRTATRDPFLPRFEPSLRIWSKAADQANFLLFRVFVTPTS